MREHILWTEKYRPATIDECILPKSLKEIFRGIVKSGDVPHLLLVGQQGSGKTTVAKAICNELGLEWMMLNGSTDNSIDDVRNTITTFASALSFSGGRRVLIYDEADFLSPNAQAGLRGVMEQCASNCAFILTCNYKDRIIVPLQSRCAVKDFKIPSEDKEAIIEEFYKRVAMILKKESVTFDSKVLAHVVMKFFPDFRRTVNELQTFAQRNGEISEAILSAVQDISLSKLITALKEQKYNKVHEWVIENSDNDPARIYRKIYDSLKSVLKPQSIPAAVIHIDDALDRSSRSADQEITLMACLIRIMVDCEFA
jgi:replication factor C small subunit